VNIYVVVEGETEKKVYSTWIPLINPALTEISSVEDVSDNNFLIVKGGGIPGYFEIIEAAVEDVHSIAAFDRLVVCVDSEELTYVAKYQEVEAFINGTARAIDYRIVVQHFCFETWALGNRRIVSRYPQSQRLREFKNHFDVGARDPELLTVIPRLTLTRARFAESYLRALLNERFRNLTYIKGHPGPVSQRTYFEQLVDRYQATGHIGSFAHLLAAIA